MIWSDASLLHAPTSGWLWRMVYCDWYLLFELAATSFIIAHCTVCKCALGQCSTPCSVLASLIGWHLASAQMLWVGSPIETTLCCYSSSWQ